jgi:NADH-quinone oxidoreductase subunit L
MSADSGWVAMMLVSIPGLPTLAVLALAIARWATGRRATERVVSSIAAVAFGTSALASFVLAVSLVGSDSIGYVVDLGPWFSVGQYHFSWTLIGDRLSLPFAVFSAGLVWTIAVFSRRYLHREEGFHRFYLMLCFFGAGVLLVVLAGSLDLIFFGWEIVGLTSALLIAFFHERKAPVEHGLRAFLTYRFCDIGLLSAAVWLHHAAGSSMLTQSEGDMNWGTLPVPPEATDAMLVGLFLIWASIGKAAQVPLGGWLPRAMEGPTPSSAIFYGAISVHLGPYLLLRSAPIFETNALLEWIIIFIGGVTAIHATFVGRVQTDIKSALAYASMTQLGVIFVEIGFGMHTLALVHIVGHASLRSLQILRSPSLLHDHHHLEQAMGEALPRSGGHFERLVPSFLQPWLYRAALERGYLDTLVVDRMVGGFVRVIRRADEAEKTWAALLAGERTIAPKNATLDQPQDQS